MAVAAAWAEVALSAVAVVGATSITHPIDLVKVRLRVPPGSSGAASGAVMPARGLFTTAVHVVRVEGLLGMWAGVSPALIRSAMYGGMRLGLYRPLKERVLPHSQTPHGAGAGAGAGSSFQTDLDVLIRKVGAGVLSGTIGSVVAHPLDVIKVRMQAAAGRGNNTRMIETANALHAEGGVRAFYAGVWTAAVRGGMLTASQAVGYEQAKLWLVDSFYMDPARFQTQVPARLLRDAVVVL
jgi:hypothetical protein